MNCCANCFSDEQIKKIIVDNGHIGDCDFCGESRFRFVVLMKQRIYQI